MALTIDEAKEAFREVAAREYADVPAPEDIDHKFSPEFYEKMGKLIATMRAEES